MSGSPFGGEVHRARPLSNRPFGTSSPQPFNLVRVSEFSVDKDAGVIAQTEDAVSRSGLTIALPDRRGGTVCLSLSITACTTRPDCAPTSPSSPGLPRWKVGAVQGPKTCSLDAAPNGGEPAVARPPRERRHLYASASQRRSTEPNSRDARPHGYALVVPGFGCRGVHSSSAARIAKRAPHGFGIPAWNSRPAWVGGLIGPSLRPRS